MTAKNRLSGLAGLERRCKVAELRSTGMSQQDIANEVGITQQGVSVMLKDEDVKAILDGVHRKYVSHADEVSDKFLEHCADEDKKISLDACKSYNKMVGFMPSPMQNQFLTQINITNDADSEQEMAGLAAFLAQKRQDDIRKQEALDAEYEDIDD